MYCCFALILYLPVSSPAPEKLVCPRLLAAAALPILKAILICYHFYYELVSCVAPVEQDLFYVACSHCITSTQCHCRRKGIIRSNWRTTSLPFHDNSPQLNGATILLSVDRLDIYVLHPELPQHSLLSPKKSFEKHALQTCFSSDLLELSSLLPFLCPVDPLRYNALSNFSMQVLASL